MTWSRSPRRLALVGLAVASLVLMPMGVATADERSDAVESQEEARRKQNELVASLEGVSAELGQAYIDLQNAQTSLANAEVELSDAQTTLAEKEREQEIATERLETATADLNTIQQEAKTSEAKANTNTESVAEIVVATYQGDNSATSWSYVLSSQNISELNRRASAMEIGSGVQEAVLAEAEAERAKNANREARQNAATQRVSTLKDEADAAEKAAQKAKNEAQTKRDEVAAATTAAQNATNQLEKEKANLESQQAQAAADEAEAAATIARIDQANRGTSAPAPAPASVSDLGGGAIGRPIDGALQVASPFGYRIHPITGESRLHAGVDLVAATGTPQYAGVSGTVTNFSNSSCGNGVFVNGGIIDGQSVILAYCHLSQHSVPDGASVSRGQTIGLTGMTGGATGPHVHFEVIINGSEVDPMSLPGF